MLGGFLVLLGKMSGLCGAHDFLRVQPGLHGILDDELSVLRERVLVLGVLVRELAQLDDGASEAGRLAVGASTRLVLQQLEDFIVFLDKVRLEVGAGALRAVAGLPLLELVPEGRESLDDGTVCLAHLREVPLDGAAGVVNAVGLSGHIVFLSFRADLMTQS